EGGAAGQLALLEVDGQRQGDVLGADRIGLGIREFIDLGHRVRLAAVRVRRGGTRIGRRGGLFGGGAASGGEGGKPGGEAQGQQGRAHAQVHGYGWTREFSASPG